jgi:hypothetical protein
MTEANIGNSPSPKWTLAAVERRRKVADAVAV